MFVAPFSVATFLFTSPTKLGNRRTVAANQTRVEIGGWRGGALRMLRNVGRYTDEMIDHAARVREKSSLRLGGVGLECALDFVGVRNGTKTEINAGVMALLREVRERNFGYFF